ncbi:hypothetical protein ACIA78_31020 [Streptomyces xanthochromogenes]|uniref:hypothetical protein n=1 Tax=Streptomyces xanthochromogenes TaxID=67384 RepID=UPI0037951C42
MTFPRGNFTITNNDSGLSLRARLGESKDISDYKEGTKYLLSKTDPPTLQLAENDGSPAFAWYFDTAEDPDGRTPYNQIVNLAVRDLQNIGNYCVTLEAGKPEQESEPFREAVERTEAARDGVGRLRSTRREFRDQRGMEWAKQPSPKPTPEEFSEQLEKDFQELVDAAKKAKEDADAHEKALDDLIPRSWTGDRAHWIRTCEIFERDGEPGIRELHRGTRPLPFPNKAEDLFPLLKKYMKAYQDGAEAPIRRYPKGRMEMGGCGKSRTLGTTYAWSTKGGFIFGADSRTVPAESTYWTVNSDGWFSAQPRGEAGQKWTIAPWTEPAPVPNLNAYALTGLFGPLGSFFA